MGINFLRESLSLLTKKQQINYWILVAFRSLSGILDLAGILSIGLLVAVASAPISGSSQIAILNISIPTFSREDQLLLFGLVLVLFLFKAFLAILLSKKLNYFLGTVDAYQANQIVKVVFGNQLRGLHKYSKADIHWALSESVAHAFSFPLGALATVISDGLLLVVMAGLLFFVDVNATIAVAIYFLLVGIIMQSFIGKKVKAAGNKYAEGIQRTNTASTDFIDTFREIFVLNLVSKFSQQIVVARRSAADNLGQIKYMNSVPRYVLETALIIGVVGFVGWQYFFGDFTTGFVTVSVFLATSLRMMSAALPVQNAISGFNNQHEQGKLALSILEQSVDIPENQPETVNSKDPWEQKALSLTVDSLTLTYPGSQRPSLSDVSLSIQAGLNIAIIGPSGSGKTSLVDCILGLYSPEKGEVFLGHYSPSELREKHPGAVAYVPQKPGLLSGTLLENITLCEDSATVDIERLNYALEAANLNEVIQALPSGLKTHVGSQNQVLSGGQIQRIGLARALYRKPKLIILDEATSALDAESEANIVESLYSLAGETTIITVAHRLSTIQQADMVVVVDSGQIIATGKFSEVRKQVTKIEEYVGLMSFD